MQNDAVIMMYVHRIIKTIVLTSVVLFIASCSQSNLCGSDEQFRVKSVNNDFESVVIKENCGATTSFSYKVFIVKRGESVEESNEVFLADHVEGLDVSWVSATSLLITYEQARIFFFKNFSFVSGKSISIVEKKLE